jgi:hypothetical protein
MVSMTSAERTEALPLLIPRHAGLPLGVKKYLRILLR